MQEQIQRPENNLFYEYRLLQFCPDITAEERINIGIYFLDQETGVGIFRVVHSLRRVKCLAPDIHEEGVKNILRTLEEHGNYASSDNTKSIEQRCKEIVSPDSMNFLWTKSRYGVTGLDFWKKYLEIYKEYLDR